MDTSSMPIKAVRGQNDTTLISYFLHEDLYTDTKALLRARVLVSTMYAFTAVCISNLLLVFFTQVPQLTRLVTSVLSVIYAAAMIYLLFVLKRHGRYMLCATVCLATTLTAVVGVVCITGGIFNAPPAQQLVLMPLVAFFFTGIRGGLLFTATVAMLIAALIVLQTAGVEFPQWIPPNFIGMAWAMGPFIGFFVIGVLALVYEFTSTALRRERDAEHAKVVKLANTDSLTGLANRRAFDSALKAHINADSQDKSQGSTEVHEFALCYLDLDGFKPINDRHGHDVGDQVLRAISIRLLSALRGADLVGRQGGDEFMLLLS